MIHFDAVGLNIFFTDLHNSKTCTNFAARSLKRLFLTLFRRNGKTKIFI